MLWTSCFVLGHAGLHGPVGRHRADPLHWRPAALPLPAARLLRPRARRAATASTGCQGSLPASMWWGRDSSAAITRCTGCSIARCRWTVPLPWSWCSRTRCSSRARGCGCAGGAARARPRSARWPRTFCGFTLVHGVHPNMVGVLAHVPWLLWALDGVAARTLPARLDRPRATALIGPVARIAAAPRASRSPCGSRDSSALPTRRT